jgi:hypothetical protein
MQSLSRTSESELQLLEQLIQRIDTPRTPNAAADPAPLNDASVPLRAALESAGSAYSCLVPFTSKIFDALGIAALADFECISIEDVKAVPVPALQKRALLFLADANNVGARLQ